MIYGVVLCSCIVHNSRLLGYAVFFFFFKQKTAYEMRISDWSSDVCSSDLIVRRALQSPLRQIAENAGWDGAVVAGKLIDGNDETLGFKIGRASCRERVCQYV